MNTERILTVIAEELGVDFGEEFRIKGKKLYRFRIERDGIYANTLLSGINATEYLMPRLISNMYEIEKLPWEPKYDEKYYYPNFKFDPPVDYYIWSGDPADVNIKRRVGVYKTKEEALEKAKELGWT